MIGTCQCATVSKERLFKPFAVKRLLGCCLFCKHSLHMLNPNLYEIRCIGLSACSVIFFWPLHVACDTTFSLRTRSDLALVSSVWTLWVAGAVWFCFLNSVNVNSKVDASYQLRWSDALWWREVGGAGLQVTAKILGPEGLSVILPTPTSTHCLLGFAPTLGAVRACSLGVCSLVQDVCPNYCSVTVKKYQDWDNSSLKKN